MASFDSEIKTVFKSNLDDAAPAIKFSSVWEQHRKTAGKRFSFKKMVAIPIGALVSLVVLLTVGFSFAAIKDKTDYPFINDPSAIGLWESVDLVDQPGQFVPGKHFSEDPLFLKQLAFMKDGNMLIAVNKGNGKLSPASCTWTKGMVLDKQDKTNSKYEIKEIDGTTYMFFEWKCGDYTYFHMDPPYFVLKQVNNEDYSKYKLEARSDKIDYPFVNDPQLLGVWESVDFVPAIDEFKPGTRISRGELFLTRFDIAGNGKIGGMTSEKAIPNDLLTWTKGLIIDRKGKVASKYEIKELAGDTYLFYEWKSGGYIYSGMQPDYYVLKKVK